MRALVVLVVGVALLVPAYLFLQQQRGPLSLLWDTIGISLGILGTLAVLLALVLALLRIIRGNR